MLLSNSAELGVVLVARVVEDSSSLVDDDERRIVSRHSRQYGTPRVRRGIGRVFTNVLLLFLLLDVFLFLFFSLVSSH